jgi:hypothetical protein
MKTPKMLAGLGLLAAALPPAVFAQITNRPSNDRPAEGGSNTLYIVGAVVVLAIVAFLVLRPKKKE